MPMIAVYQQKPGITSTAYKIAGFVPYLLLSVGSYSVFAVTMDDPYITFRYAANLVAGHGPVFNTGERVEGYTSILHLILCVILLKFMPALDILFKAKILSLIFAATMLLQTRALAKLAGLREYEALITQILVVSNINFALAAVNALETTLYGVLLLGSIYLFVNECKSGIGNWSGFFLFLTLLARPDTLLVFTGLSLLRVFLIWRAKKPIVTLLNWFLAFLVPTCLLLLARWEYYGSLLPNTYYAKQVPLSYGLLRGTTYWLRGLYSVVSPAQLRGAMPWMEYLKAICGLLFWLLASIGLLKTRKTILSLALFTAIIAEMVLVFRSGGDWMPGWRFLVPVLPLIAILQCYGLQTIKKAVLLKASRQITDRSGFSFKWREFVFYTVLLILWTIPFYNGPNRSWGTVHFSTHGNDLIMPGSSWVEAGRYMRQSLPINSYIASSEMGYASYLNMDKFFLDTRGLTDSQVSHLPSKYKRCAGVTDGNWMLPDDPLNQILRQKKPEFIIDYTGVYQKVVSGHYVHFATVNTSSDNRQPRNVIQVYRLGLEK